MSTPSGFWFKGYVVRWVDPDTLIVDAQVDAPDIHKRIRLKDVWSLETKDDPVGAARLVQWNKDNIGDVGDLVVLQNTRIHFTYTTRLEARVDPA